MDPDTKLEFTDMLEGWSGVEDGGEEGLGDPPDRTVETVAMVNSSRLIALYPFQSDHLGNIGRSSVSFYWVFVEV